MMARVFFVSIVTIFTRLTQQKDDNNQAEDNTKESYLDPKYEFRDNFINKHLKYRCFDVY